MDQERRTRERVSVQFDVSVVLGEESVQVRIINISLTGILCTFHPLFRKGASCKVKIALSDNVQMTIDSKILRVGEQGTAISFVELDEESFVHLMWCSTMRVTHTAAKENSGDKPVTENTTGPFPSENDKSLMLQTFGMPPDKKPIA
jgi:hypothetical protein